jgi:class 3 adenylate cyclase
MTSAARWAGAPDYPAGLSEQAVDLAKRLVQDTWGTEAMAEFAAPDIARRDATFRRWFAKTERLYMSPKEMSRLFDLERSLDVRDALSLVRVPTLVLHTEGYEVIPASNGRYLADHIAGARFALVPGTSAIVWVEPGLEAARHHIDEFLGGLMGGGEPDRALAAILFTDIVGSTAHASALGDREWRNLLETHDAVARTVVEQHRGRLVKTTGDGILATFDGPGRAIRCATILTETLRPLGVEIRAGLHAGEIEMRGADIAGIGVHIAARVMDAASPGECLVSSAVPMLVAGSAIDFVDRGEHELKGIPGSWRLYAVAG